MEFIFYLAVCADIFYFSISLYIYIFKYLATCHGLFNHDTCIVDLLISFVMFISEFSTKKINFLGLNRYRFVFQGETKPFKPYSKRYRVPYKASESTAPFWYSIKRASAHIIVLASYSAYGNDTFLDKRVFYI